jgi:hypothetical protein
VRPAMSSAIPMGAGGNRSARIKAEGPRGKVPSFRERSMVMSRCDSAQLVRERVNGQ